jgi:hypothetical protein
MYLWLINDFAVRLFLNSLKPNSVPLCLCGEKVLFEALRFALLGHNFMRGRLANR